MLFRSLPRRDPGHLEVGISPEDVEVAYRVLKDVDLDAVALEKLELRDHILDRIIATDGRNQRRGDIR